NVPPLTDSVDPAVLKSASITEEPALKTTLSATPISTLSAAPGTTPVLQLAAVPQLPPFGPIHWVVKFGSVKVIVLLIPVLPAASVTCAVSELLPAFSATDVLQLPSAWTGVVAIGVLPPFSKISTVALASPISTLPLIVTEDWLVLPPVPAIATIGAAVSIRTPVSRLTPPAASGLPKASMFEPLSPVPF